MQQQEEKQEEIINALPPLDPRVITAHHFPRDYKKITEEMTYIITETDFFEKVCYALPRREKEPGTNNYKNKWVVGPTVYLAREIAKLMGNLVVEQFTEAVKPDDKVVTGVGMVYDMEKNIAWKVTVSKNITYQDGNRYKDDLITLNGVAASAIGARNAILNIVPSYLIDQCIKLSETRIASSDELKNPNKWLKKVQEAVAKLMSAGRASEKEVFDLLEVKSYEEIKQEHLYTLVRVTTAIFTKDITPDDVFNRNGTPSGKKRGVKFDFVEKD